MPHCCTRTAAATSTTTMTASLPTHALNCATDAAATYAAFLGAIAARDFERIDELATERLRAELRGMRSCASFPALFDMWCESYPKSAKSVPVRCDEQIAILDMRGEVDGESVNAQVLLRRVDGHWRVDKEHFRCGMRC